MPGEIVYYNGKTEYWIPCDDPTILIKNKPYKIIGFNDGNYILENIEGCFNPLWFSRKS